MQVWSESTHYCRRQGADKPVSTNLSLSVTLKMGSRSPKSNQFFSMSQQYSCTSLVKSIIHSGDKVHTNHFQTNLSPPMTLKMGQGHQPNLFFYMSQHCRCAGLVKIYSFLQEIGCGQAFFQQSNPSCDLEIGGKVIKI